MDFSYYSPKGEVKKINIEVGKSWKSQQTTNKLINTLFQMIDNGDGVVQESEYLQLSNLLAKADTLIPQSAKNKTVDCKELGLLIKKFNNKELNIKDYKNTPYKINPNDYTFTNLKKRYPDKLYNIDVNCYGSIDLINITEKKTGKTFAFTRSPQGVINISHLNKNGVATECIQYDKNGIISYIEKNNKKRYPIIEQIHQAISSKNSIGLPTTDLKKLQAFTRFITPNNVDFLMEQYKKTYKKDLISDIKNEFGLYLTAKTRNEKDKIINHITNCYNKSCGYKATFTRSNSQITNKYHKGDNHKITCKNDILTVTNTKNHITKTIDLKKLTSDFDNQDAIQLKGYIQNLPGEVIMDIATECTDIFDGQSKLSKLYTKLNKIEDAGAYYNREDDDITLHVNKESEVTYGFAHELGHAIDYLSNQKAMSETKEFKNSYNTCIKKYQANGGKIFSNKNYDEIYYATQTAQEMFAECYSYLMTGKAHNVALLTKHFSECLKATEKILQKVRTMPQNIRHEK